MTEPVPVGRLGGAGAPPLDLASLSPDDPRLGRTSSLALRALQMHGPDAFPPEVSQGFMDMIEADLGGTTGYGGRLADDLLGLPESLVRGVAEIPGQVVDMSNLANQGLGALADLGGMEGVGDYLSNDMQAAYGSQWFNENLSDALMGEQPAPRTDLGNILNTSARWGGNSIVPFTRTNSLTVPLGMAGGAASGMMEEAGAPEWLQAATGIGTMVGGGIAANRVSSGARLARDALSGTTNQQYADALTRMGQSYDQGVPLMASEALDTPGLRNVVGDILATGGRGANELQSFLSARPGQVRAAGEAAIERVSPTMTETPIGVAQNVNETGTQIIGDARGARSSAVKPFYQAARGLPVVDSAPVTILLDAIDLDLRNGVVGGQARSLVEQFRNQVAGAVNENGEYTVSALDSIYKHWRDLANNATNPAAPTENQITLSAIGELGDYVAEIGRISGTGTPVERGRALYREMSPAVEAVTGTDNVSAIPQRLADGADIGQLADALLDPNTARPADIGAVFNAIRSSDGDVPAMMGSVQDLMRTHLENEFARATSDLQSGERLTGGARFAANVTGNDQAAQNLDFVLREIDPEVADGFEALMETFRRTGLTPAEGSPTAGRAPRLETAGDNIVSGVADALPIIGSGRGVLSGLSSAMRRFTQGRAHDRLARYLTSPNGIEQLRQLARLGPYDARAATLAATILNAAGEFGGDGEAPTAAPTLQPVGRLSGF